MYTAGSSVWITYGKLSTEGAAQTVGGKQYVPCRDGDWQDWEFVRIHLDADLPDVVGIGAASYSSVGYQKVVEWYFNLVVYCLVEHDNLALHTPMLKLLTF